MAATPSGQGYWLVADDGGIFAYGDAGFYGSTGAVRLNRPIVGMAATSTGLGYWLVASDGGIFAYGDAQFWGSTGGMRLNRPVVGMAASPTGTGYWLVASDGGIFNFGDALFHGSAGDVRLVQPIVAMARTASGLGYWLAAADGGVFAYGDAGFHGSATPFRPSRPVAAITATPSGQGYWLASGEGSVYSFGDAGFAGSAAGAVPPGRNLVGMAGTPDGGGYWTVAGTDLLVPGSLGGSVEAVQRRLLELGYWVPVNGRFDEVMRQAVYALEKSAGLPRRGQVGAAERNALEDAVRPPARSKAGMVIEIDKARQIITVVNDGQPRWIFNTSTGNGKPYTQDGRRAVANTPVGSFRIERAINGVRVSDLGELFRPRYFVGGYAIHGSPSIPPFPASHGCARVSNAAINFIWDANIMPIGTPVLVYN
jgi:hypothetical protein